MNKKMLALIALSATLILSFSGKAAELEETREQDIHDHVKFLNELSDRRRTKILFQNPQLISDGVQVSFVNTTTGNLTFARVDLGLAGFYSAGVSRVYDSRLGRSDFGYGWKLASHEYLVVRKRSARYYFGHGGDLRMQISEEGVMPPEGYPAIAGFVRVGEDAFEQNLDGLIKKFERIEPGSRKFHLTSMIDESGHGVRFGFDDQEQLVRVSNTEGRWVQLNRRADGLVLSAQDSQGRLVTYEYNDEGLLSANVDLGRYKWKYRYDDGLLTKLIAPTGRNEVRAGWKEGRVCRIEIGGIKKSFAYGEGFTQVRSGGNEWRFSQSSSGVTLAVESASGFSKLSLDENNMVRSLSNNGNETKIEYSLTGRVNRMVEEGVNLFSATYQRDALIGIDSEAGLYELDPHGSFVLEVRGRETHHFSNGKISRYESPTKTIQIKYQQDGHVRRVSDGSSFARFKTDDLGRITSIRNQNDTLKFGYNELGFRNRIDQSNGVVSYDYGPLGHMTAATIDSKGLGIQQQFVESDEFGRVTKINYGEEAVLEIGYTDSGLPDYKLANGKKTEFTYDELGRFKSVESEDGTLSYDYSEGELDLRLQNDKTTAVTFLAATQSRSMLRNDFLRKRFSNYESVIFLEESMSFHTMNDAASHSYALAQIKSLDQANLLTVLNDLRPIKRLSNPAFLPLEYEAINCCLPCDMTPHLCGYCYHLLDGESICYCQVNDCNPPPPTIVPTGLPTFTYLGLVNGGNSWGATLLETFNTLGCELLCPGGDYRVEGDIYLTSASYIRIAQDKQAVAACYRNRRSNQRIFDTGTHELVHANALRGVINTQKTMIIGNEYSTRTACNNALNNRLIQFNMAFSSEISRQRQHLDHNGERRFAAFCPGSGPTQEVGCGLNGFNCSPSNFYPGL